jgi:hypothetical protein
MSDHDPRQLTRDSLFLMAELRLAHESAVRKVRVRNLSAGGMMAEGDIGAVRGTHVSVNIRNIGWVEGTIAWVQGDRSGIAFAQDIDPMIARAPVIAGEGTPRFVKPPLALGPERLRKI